MVDILQPACIFMQLVRRSRPGCTGGRTAAGWRAGGPHRALRWQSRISFLEHNNLLEPSHPVPHAQGSFCFFLSGMFGDLLLIRLCLVGAYVWLLIAAAVGYPIWPDTLNAGWISLDGIVWCGAVGRARGTGRCWKLPCRKCIGNAHRRPCLPASLARPLAG